MKRISIILHLLNILIGIMIYSNYFFVFNYNSYSIPLFIPILIFYIVMSIIYFKNNNTFDKTDILFNSIYYLFILSLFIFSMIYQVNNSYTFNLIYFTKFMIIPHIIKEFYDIIKKNKEGGKK